MTRTTKRLALFLPTFATIASTWCSAWTPPASAAAKLLDKVGSPSVVRRDFLRSSLVVVVGSASPSWWVVPSPANAASASPQDKKDMENIVRGYTRLQYLLDNWEAETTVCKIGQEVGWNAVDTHFRLSSFILLPTMPVCILITKPLNAQPFQYAHIARFFSFSTKMTQHQTTFGDKCERNPTKVMEYLGFKSTSDPLFKAESTMMRLKASVPPDRESEFYDAIDAFSQNAEEANSMAFVSSWGESNPGGGKDRVRLFIERSRNNVVKSRDSLRTVMDILDLEP